MTISIVHSASPRLIYVRQTVGLVEGYGFAEGPWNVPQEYSMSER